MKSLQAVFDDLQESQREYKELNSIYRDALANSSKHQDLKEKIKEYRDQKKSIEYTIQAQMGADYDKIEKLSLHIKELKEMLSDIALNQYTKGELVSVQDKHENEYEPLVSIRFKKVI